MSHTQKWVRSHRLPAVLLVNFCVDGDGAVLLRTSAHSELVSAVCGVVVAFEADEVDALAHSGWSVVGTGRATEVRDPDEHARLCRVGPCSWAPSPRKAFLRVEPELITGRELVAGRSGTGWT